MYLSIPFFPFCAREKSPPSHNIALKINHCRWKNVAAQLSRSLTQVGKWYTRAWVPSRTACCSINLYLRFWMNNDTGRIICRVRTVRVWGTRYVSSTHGRMTAKQFGKAWNQCKKSGTNEKWGKGIHKAKDRTKCEVENENGAGSGEQVEGNRRRKGREKLGTDREGNMPRKKERKTGGKDQRQ